MSFCPSRIANRTSPPATEKQMHQDRALFKFSCDFFSEAVSGPATMAAGAAGNRGQEPGVRYSPGRSYWSSVRVSRNSSRIRMSFSIQTSWPSRVVT